MPLAGMFGVSGYPTLKWMPKGSTMPNEAEDVNAQRSADGLANFINEKIGKPLSGSQVRACCVWGRFSGGWKPKSGLMCVSVGVGFLVVLCVERSFRIILFCSRTVYGCAVQGVYLRAVVVFF